MISTGDTNMASYKVKSVFIRLVKVNAYDSEDEVCYSWDLLKYTPPGSVICS